MKIIRIKSESIKEDGRRRIAKKKENAYENTKGVQKVVPQEESTIGFIELQIQGNKQI
jgi:hypothetical protein